MLILSPARRRAARELQAGLAAAEDLPPDQGRQADRRHLRGRDHQHAVDARASRTPRRAGVGRSRSAGSRACRRRADANLKVLADWVDEDAVDRFPRRRSGDALEHLGLPHGRRSGGHRARCRRRRRRSPRRSCRGSTRPASPTTSASIAMRRRACASGPASTVETADLEALTPWLDWAFARREGRAARPRPEPANASRERPARCRSAVHRSILSIRRGRGMRRRHRSGGDAARRASHAQGSHFRQALARPPSRSSRTAASRSTTCPISARTRTSCSRSSASMTASPSARRPRSPRRSSPRPTKLKVIGRAGIGVDNVDIPAATKQAASS